MQDIDNDMDDLFQRAAENYPLRVDNGDWESIARKIADAPAAFKCGNNPGKKRYKNNYPCLITFYRVIYLVYFPKTVKHN